MSKNVLGISLIAAVLYTVGHYLAHWIGRDALNFTPDQSVIFVTGVVFVSTFLGTWLVTKK